MPLCDALNHKVVTPIALALGGRVRNDDSAVGLEALAKLPSWECTCMNDLVYYCQQRPYERPVEDEFHRKAHTFFRMKRLTRHSDWDFLLD